MNKNKHPADRPAAFTEQLMRWHRDHNQRSLPWKSETDPYKIWLSEIMLQQTRAEQGLPYYEKFTSAYPDITALANASDNEVFKLWEGLGYYARCRNMLATARKISGEYKGVFPDTYEGIRSLKGVGPYTAAAIASFAFGLPHAVVDGNVYRLLARYFGISTPIDSVAGKKEFQALADGLLDRSAPGAFNQAMMDLGATVCTPQKPLCEACPLANTCQARNRGLIDMLPVKEKKITVRTRYFNYILLLHDEKIWLRQRLKGDVWAGLFEPFLIESESIPDRNALSKQILEHNLNLQPERLEFEGELKQRLTHQLIYSRFYRVNADEGFTPGAEGLWVPLSALKDYALPRTLITFFQKKGYF